MGAPDAAVRIDDLLAHREWVRGLAMALARDPTEADDLEQETWLSALRSPPRPGVPARGWLTTVVRNAMRQRRRADARRSERERRVASRADAVHEPPDVVERAELHARIAAAVVALPEPYRRAVLLRHFEDHPVAEVARLSGVPLETARARLRRGRALLRERLTEDLGGARPLAVLLLPLIGRDGVGTGLGTAAAVAGGVVMSTKIVAGAAVVLLAAGAVWWGTRDAAQPQANDGMDVAAADEPPGLPDTPAARPPRERVHPSEQAAASDTPTEEQNPPVEPVRSVAERLETQLGPVQFDEQPLVEVLGELSARLDVPVHAQTTVRERLNGPEAAVSLHLDVSETAANVLRLMLTFRGLALDVETDRIVVRAAAAEVTTESTPTFEIVPLPFDPDAPRTLTVRARVLLPDGGPAVGARLAGPDAPDTPADVAGTVEFETELRNVRLSASLPFHERSSRWNGRGVPGDLLEPELVLGPPAGAVDVTVSCDGSPVEGAKVHLSWQVPGRTIRRRGPDGTREVPKLEASVLLTGPDGTASDACVAVADVTVKVSKNGFSRNEKVVQVTAGERHAVSFELAVESLAARLGVLRTSFRFEDAEPKDVVRYIASTQRLNIMIDPGFAPELGDRTVSLGLFDVSVERALDELCTAIGGCRVRIDEDTAVVMIERDAD